MPGASPRQGGLLGNDRQWKAVAGAALTVVAFLWAPGPTAAAPDLIHHGSAVVEAPPTDDDGVVEPGEGFTLSETLRNRGDAAASGVAGALSTSSPNLTLTGTASVYPGIPAGSTAANSTPFAGRVSSADSCGSTLPMSLAVSSDQGPFTFPSYIRPGTVPLRKTESPPLAIADNAYTGTLQSMTSSTLTVPLGGTIRDLDVVVSRLDHSWIGDLDIKIKSPAGTVVTLVERIGNPAGSETSNDFFDATLDDQASTSVLGIDHPTTSYSPAVVGRYQPGYRESAVGNLSAFAGQAAAGTWTLYVGDGAVGDVRRHRS